MNLSWNEIEEIAESIANFSDLIKLDLSNNKISILPESIGNLSALSKLYLRDNQLINLPESIGNLSSLTKLDLSHNKISILPESIGNLSSLTKLDLSHNKISILPESIANLSSLTKLDLSHNKISILPESIANFSSLTKLDLSHNKISILPESIGNLSALSELYLGHNQISTLPNSIGNLSTLTVLNLRDNQISTLPNSISNLSDLSELYLGINQISVLPNLIDYFPNLNWLDSKDNPLEIPPIEIAKKGIDAIREYFRQLKEEGKEYIYEAKLLIVGEPGAGKTSLANKILNPNYQLRHDEETTKGIDVIKWSFSFLDQEQNERNFQVNIWDFGGHAIYHATHQFFLTKRSLYTLVADTRREDTDFYYWLNVVELLSDNSPLLIVKNEKGDRYIDIDENSLRGRFKNLKESLATNFKTNRGLDKILTKIQHFIQDLPHVGSALPKTWKRVRESLEQDERNYISLEEYLQICQDNGFTQLKDKLQLSGYLHDLGVCLHFQDSPLLKNTVILKPKWGTDAVYKVLDDKQVINNLGRFTNNDLDNIWSDEQYLFKQAELLELMMRFNLCYQIPETQDTYIAPQLLAKTKPNYKWNETDNLILRYTYEFMPKGIITQFIVAMHQDIYQQKYVWRSGVLLNKDETFAEVIEYYERREIKIRVSGKRKKDLLTIITHELDKIHNSYQRLKYRKLIPCHCSECKNQQEPYFHPFDVLQKAKEKRQREVQCQKSFQMVDVLNLIDDVIIQHNSEKLDSALNLPQTTTNIEQHFHGNVGSATGTIEGNHHSGDINMKGDRHINIDKGNYNERIEGDYIQGSYTNQSRTQNISGGTINATGAGALGLGDISGTVANTINQLPTSPDSDQPGIKELLSQLKDAIEAETGLDETDKSDALEEIQNLAEVSQEEDENTKKTKAGKSLRMLGRITKALPPTAALMTICKDLLPAISHFFGL